MGRDLRRSREAQSGPAGQGASGEQGATPPAEVTDSRVTAVTDPDPELVRLASLTNPRRIRQEIRASLAIAEQRRQGKH